MPLPRSFAAAALAAALVPAAMPADAQLGLPQIPAQGKRPAVAVIVWHDVVPSKEVWFDTTSAEFAQELAAIARGGYHVVTLDAMYAHLARGAPLPSRPLVLTFDDNGIGIYRNAFPLLRRYRFHATTFVHTNYVGRITSKHHCSWSDLADMERSGLVNVQSQTANHPRISGCSRTPTSRTSSSFRAGRSARISITTSTRSPIPTTTSTRASSGRRRTTATGWASPRTTGPPATRRR